MNCTVKGCNNKRTVDDNLFCPEHRGLFIELCITYNIENISVQDVNAVLNSFCNDELIVDKEGCLTNIKYKEEQNKPNI